jgi:hypothetical protein
MQNTTQRKIAPDDMVNDSDSRNLASPLGHLMEGTGLDATSNLSFRLLIEHNDHLHFMVVWTDKTDSFALPVLYCKYIKNESEAISVLSDCKISTVNINKTQLLQMYKILPVSPEIIDTVNYNCLSDYIVHMDVMDERSKRPPAKILPSGYRHIAKFGDHTIETIGLLPHLVIESPDVPRTEEHDAIINLFQHVEDGSGRVAFLEAENAYSVESDIMALQFDLSPRIERTGATTMSASYPTGTTEDPCIVDFTAAIDLGSIRLSDVAPDLLSAIANPRVLATKNNFVEQP